MLGSFTDVNVQLPISWTFHLNLDAEKTNYNFSFREFVWAVLGSGLIYYPFQKVKFRQHGGSHQLHGRLFVPLRLLLNAYHMHAQTD